jgi:hypothetical protein
MLFKFNAFIIDIDFLQQLQTSLATPHLINVLNFKNFQQFSKESDPKSLHLTFAIAPDHIHKIKRVRQQQQLFQFYKSFAL